MATHGDLLGVLPTVRLQTAELKLRPGDSLVAYTDGVTDQGPELTTRPQQALRDVPGTSADALAASLERLARPHIRHPDDVAVIALRFLGGDPLSTSRSPAAVTVS